jgi:hypothetical protein
VIIISVNAKKAAWISVASAAFAALLIIGFPIAV